MKSYLKFLSRNKGYTAINIIGLALSMMFVVLIGGFAWQEYHVDSQYENRSRIFLIAARWQDYGVQTGTNWRVQHLLREKFPEITSSACLRRADRDLILPDGQKVEAHMLLTDSTFSDFFPTKLIVGDWETALADERSIIVTPDFARKAWGNDNPIGKSVVLSDTVPLYVSAVMEPIINSSLTRDDGSSYDIIGRFELMEFIDWWAFSPMMNQIGGTDILLLAPEGVDLSDRGPAYQRHIIDRCTAMNNYFNQFGDEEASGKVEIVPFDGFYLSNINKSNTKRPNMSMLSLYMIAALVILVFALMNYINLTTAIASRRAKEMATRRLLGSSRMHVMMRFIGEGVLLCAIAMAIGISLAFLLRPGAEYMLRQALNLKDCFTPLTLLIIIIIVLVIGFMAGIIPAVLVSSPKPIDVVRGTYRRRSKMIFSKIFIVVQNTITIVLLASCLTVYLQHRHMLEAPLGYDFENVVSVPLPADANQASQFIDEVKQLPCVEMVSKSSSIPLYSGHNNTCSFEGNSVPFQLFFVDENWMPLFRIETERDNGPKNGTYVNRQLFKDLGLEDDAQSFKYCGNSNGEELIRGVMKDVKLGTILSSQRPMIVYVDNDSENSWLTYSVYIRVKGDQTEAYRQIHQLYLDITGISLGTPTPYIQQQPSSGSHIPARPMNSWVCSLR